MTTPTVTDDQLDAWIANERQWGDVDRQPYYRAIRERLDRLAALSATPAVPDPRDEMIKWVHLRLLELQAIGLYEDECNGRCNVCPDTLVDRLISGTAPQPGAGETV